MKKKMQLFLFAFLFLAGCTSLPAPQKEKDISGVKFVIGTDVFWGVEGKLWLYSKGREKPFESAKIHCELFPWDGGGARKRIRESRHLGNIELNVPEYQDEEKYILNIVPILNAENDPIPKGKYVLRVTLDTDKGKCVAELPYWVGYRYRY